MKTSSQQPQSLQPPKRISTTTALLQRMPGFEEVGPGDVKVPRLAFAQALTPQLEETNAESYPGSKQGRLF